MFSLSAAAKRARVSKATIHRAIKSGKLSAIRRDDGSYEIDPAELSRVYEIGTGEDTGRTPETSVEPVSGGSDETTRNPSRNANGDPQMAVLQAELAAARQLIRVFEEQVADLRKDRDGWRQQAEASQRLLTHSQGTAPVSRPWWRRLAG